jgi:hypothetical protein
MSLGELGLTTGDTVWYGYVYSATGITSFLTATFGTDYIFENHVSIEVQ